MTPCWNAPPATVWTGAALPISRSSASATTWWRYGCCHPRISSEPWNPSTWPPGASLTFSLGLPLAPADWSGLSLAVGLSLATSLNPAIGLKWPNDLWWQERKLGGILIETAAVGAGRQAIIGVGLNIALPTCSDGLRTPAAALQELLPGIDAPLTLLRLAQPLARTLKSFESGGFSPFVAGFHERDVLSGREVVLSDGTQGVARGIDPSGALLVHTAAGLQRLTSSEVSVRPRPDVNP